MPGTSVGGVQMWVGVYFNKSIENIECICWSQIPYKKYLKSREVDQKTSQYLVWQPFVSCSVTLLIFIELIVACGMLSHSSSMALQSWWLLAGTETRCCTHHPRAYQTCSMSEYAGH
jgi:hypothetical protein